MIGYQATTVTPAKRQPSAAAALPSMRIFPAVLFIRSTRTPALAKLAWAYSKPLSSAPPFSAIALGFFPSCLPRAFFISSSSMSSRNARTPS